MKRWMLLILPVVAGCVDDLSLDDRPCPCADGWICCAADDVCVRPGVACPGTSAQTLAVTPPTARLRLGGEQLFVATAGAAWSVDESDGGTIDTGGHYRAPLRPGTYHVRAIDDRGESVTATATVGPMELAVAAGVIGGSGHADGIGADARFSMPVGIAGDGVALYVSDRERPPYTAVSWTGKGWIRKVDPASGEVTTLAADLKSGPLAIDGGGVYASVTTTWQAGTALGSYDAIVRVDPSTGAVTPIVGGHSACQSGPRDGAAGDACFSTILGMAADGAGALYVAEGSVLRRVAIASGAVTTLATNGAATLPVGADPAAVAVVPFGSLGALVLYQGDVYAADAYEGDVSGLWKYHPATGSLVNVPPSASAPLVPAGLAALAVDPRDINPLPLWAVQGNAIWSVGLTGSVTEAGDIDGGRTTARFNGPTGLCSGAGSTFYVADTGNAKLRTIHDGTVSSLAGQSEHAGAEDGIGTAARLAHPRRLAVDEAGDVFFIDDGGIRRIDAKTGAVGFELVPVGVADSLTVGGGTLFHTYHYSTEPGMVSGIAFGHQIAIDSQGDARYLGLGSDGESFVYVVEALGGSVQRFDVASLGSSLGSLETIADGFVGPTEIAVDGTRRVFVSDQKGLHQIALETRVVTDLPSPKEGWGAIRAMAYDPAGVLYIVGYGALKGQTFDDEGDIVELRGGGLQVRALVVDSGEIYDLAGTAGHQGVALGSLPGAVNAPSALAILPDGSVAIADQAENAVLIAR